MRGYPRPVDRDMLELMVAYGLLPGTTVDAEPGGLPPVRERDPSSRSSILGLVGNGPHAGLTTVVVGLAQAWSSQGLHVLLVDLDPSEELSRLLQVGASVFAGSGNSLLRALREGLEPEALGTLLPEVDIVVGGTINTWDPDALAEALRRRPERLREALAPVAARYDRVLIDCPSVPLLVPRQVAQLADGVVPVVRCEPPLPTAGDLAGAPVLGAVLTRWRPDVAVDPEWLRGTFGPGSPWFDTVLPEFPGVRDPWDVVAGTGGPSVDLAFRRLAAEIDARLAGPSPETE